MPRLLSVVLTAVAVAAAAAVAASTAHHCSPAHSQSKSIVKRRRLLARAADGMPEVLRVIYATSNDYIPRHH